jgi:hypothetical protein
LRACGLAGLRACGLAGLVALTISACGGGEDGANTNNPQISLPPLQTGQFRDSPVEGLRYESVGNFGRTDGVTDLNGQFMYREGDQVSFYLGSHRIAGALGSPLLTTYSATTTDQEASNLARLLQNLDEDQNPNNGIRVTSAANTNARQLQSLNLQSEISDLQLQQIASSLYPGVSRTLIGSAEAESHAALSIRLSLLKGNEIYDVIVGRKSYPSAYNKTKLDSSARKRLQLYIWSKWQQPMMQTVLDSQAGLIGDIDAEKRRNDAYIDLADALGDVVLLGVDTKKFISGVRSNQPDLELLFKIKGDLAAGIVTTVPAIEGVFSDSESAQTTDASGYPIAKAGLYAFGALGGSVGSGINATKEIVKATSDDPAIAVAADTIAAGVGQYFDGLINDVKTGKLILKGKTAGLSLAKDLTIAGARGANAIAAVPSIQDSIKVINTYLVAKDVLNLWYESAGDSTFISSRLFGQTNRLISILDMVDKIAGNYGFEERTIFASDWDRGLAHSLVSEQLGRTNALYRTYTRRIGANSEDFDGVIIGLPSTGQTSRSYTLSLDVRGSTNVEHVTWSIDDGRSTTQFTSRQININFDKTGTFTISAIAKLPSGNFSTAASQITVHSHSPTAPITPSLSIIPPAFGSPTCSGASSTSDIAIWGTPSQSGNQIVYTVMNAGPGTACGVNVEVTLRSATNQILATSTLAYPSIPAGISLLHVYTASGLSLGAGYQTRGVVSSNSPDSYALNNTSVVNFTVAPSGSNVLLNAAVTDSCASCTPAVHRLPATVTDGVTNVGTGRNLGTHSGYFVITPVNPVNLSAVSIYPAMAPGGNVDFEVLTSTTGAAGPWVSRGRQMRAWANSGRVDISLGAQYTGVRAVQIFIHSSPSWVQFDEVQGYQ